MSRLTSILDAIRNRDYAIATESIAQVMQRKVEAGLAKERERIAHGLVAEDTESDRGWKRTYGFNKSGQVIFSAPGKLSYEEVHEIDPYVVKVEVHGREWGDLKNFDELTDYPGFTGFSIEKWYGRTQSEIIKDLARIGIPAEPHHTIYQGHVGIRVPLKYTKKAGKHLFGESVVREAPETVLASTAKFNAEAMKLSGDKILCQVCKRREGTIYAAGKNDSMFMCRACYRNEYGNVREDSSGGRATPGKCAKCGKPAKWYHNRLDKKFCDECGPKDTMSRILPVKEAVEETKEKLLCHDCGNVFMGSHPCKCPECGCRKCVNTDEPLSEGWGDDYQERIVRHTCKGCGNMWMGPAYEDECPKCFKRQYGESFDKDYPNRKDQREPYYRSGEKALRSNRPGGDPDSWDAQNRQHSTRKRELSAADREKDVEEDCGLAHKVKSALKEAACSGCGKTLGPVDAVMGSVCGKCAREGHKKATGKK